MKIWSSTFFNVAGFVVPTLIAIPAMGVLARYLGVEKFGIFMLAFTLLGYASIFDFGMNRAVVRKIAINNNEDKLDKILMETAFSFIFLISIIVAIVFFIFSSNISDILKVASNNRADVIDALRLIALAIPLTLLSLIGFSLLEGRQLFLKLNIYKALTSSAIAIFPVLAVAYENSLTAAISGIFFARLITLLFSLKLCQNLIGKCFFGFDKKTLYELFSFGGWITLSNVISMLMGSIDRFIIANLLGAKQAAFYAAPADAVARLGIIPGALSKTIFPYFSANNDVGKNEINKIYFLLFLILIFILTPCFIFAEDIFVLWLGAAYAENSSTIFRILLIGFLFNALAQIPYSKIQAAGNSKITAILHLVEVIPYFLILFFLLDKYGVMGAAMAWSIRVALDFAMLEFIRLKKRV